MPTALRLVDDGGLTSFPLSHSLPASPLSPEDATFSILPRYLLQKVKSTFTAAPGDAGQSNTSADNSVNNYKSASKQAFTNNTPRYASNTSASQPASRPASPALAAVGSGTRDSALSHRKLNTARTASSSAATRSSSPVSDAPVRYNPEINRWTQEIANAGSLVSAHGPGDSVVSRNPRLASLSGGKRRAAAPVLSKPLPDTAINGRPVAGGSERLSYLSSGLAGGYGLNHIPMQPSSLSRSHLRSLETLDESPVDTTSKSSYFQPASVPRGQGYSAIPGFPLLNRDPNEDARSVVSSAAASTNGVAQIFKRLKGESLSREYWMADEHASECYDCNAAFTAWRRKHHCRVCGRIFCARCASNIIPGARFGHEGLVRVCNICLAMLSHSHRTTAGDPGQDDAPLKPSTSVAQQLLNASIGANFGGLNERPGLPTSQSVADLKISLPIESTYRAPQSQFSASVLFPRNDFSNYNLAANLSSEDLSLLARRNRRSSEVSMMRPETPDVHYDSAPPTPWHPTLGTSIQFLPQGESHALPSAVSPLFGSAAPSTNASPSMPAATPAPFRTTLRDDDKGLHTEERGFGETEGETSSTSLAAYVSASVSGTGSPVHSDEGRVVMNANEGLGLIMPPGHSGLMSPQKSADALRHTVSFPTLGGSHPASTIPDLPSYDPSLIGGPATSSGGRPGTPSALSGPIGSTIGSLLGMPPIRSRLDSRAADQVFDFGDLDTRRLSETHELPQVYRSQSRSLSFVNDVELASAALGHIRRLLRQQLKQAQVSKADIWQEELLRILVNVARWPMPDVAAGDSMDVRKYVKIKRVPGGLPSDSEYVDGTVFTKSLLNKSLPRMISNPRVMLFNYAFEFEHDESKMVKLDSLRESERDSLRKLCNSVIDHRPNIVLVAKGVSGLALDYLHKAHIIVARNVKQSVLKAVARSTGAGIHTTYQHFPDTIKSGRCRAFRAETVEHSLIPGRRKTMMRFEGCNKELGATIILRGGDLSTLSTIKRIMRFMTLAVYSIRLEMGLLWDEHAAIPPAIELAKLHEVPDDEDGEAQRDLHATLKKTPAKGDAQKEVARLIARAVRPYIRTILSTSPTVLFPPPYSLNRLRIDNDKIDQLRHPVKQMNPIEDEDSQQPDVSIAAPVPLPKGGEPEAALQTSAALTRSLSDVSLLSVKPQTRTMALQISAELAEADQVAEAETRRDEHLHMWENRLARHQDDLLPTAHQHLTVLETVVCSTTLKACVAPTLARRYYYKCGSDLTLRQFVEILVQSSGQKCITKQCDKPMLAHYTTCAHGQSRLHIVLEAYIMARQHEDDILMWSYCKLCKLTTDPTLMSVEGGNYSFAKYLELSFYHDELYCRLLACPHNIHKDHVRYFAYKNMSVCMYLENIDVSDVVVPPLHVRTDAWTQLRIKNEEYGVMQKAIAAYWESVLGRIKNFNYDLLPPDRLEMGRQALQALEARAEEERDTFTALLDKTYEQTQLSQPSALNSARHALQVKQISWDNEFQAFEQKYLASDFAERTRRATSTQLRRLFDPAGSAPASPDYRNTFSPMPTVPSSPVAPPATPIIGSPPIGHNSLGIMAMFSNAILPTSSATSSASSVTSTSESGTLQSESATPMVEPSRPNVDIPTFELTEANLAQLPAHTPEIPNTSSAPSVIDHGEGAESTTTSNALIADQPGSDSDSTVCAEPTGPSHAISSYDSMRSESEDQGVGVAMRAVKIRKPKPVPSIANLVQRFEASPETQPSSSPSAPASAIQAKPKKAMLSPPSESSRPLSPRPSVRRLRSDYTEVRSSRVNNPEENPSSVLSDGDVPPMLAPVTAWKGRPSRLPRSPMKTQRPSSPMTDGKKRRSIDSAPVSDTDNAGSYFSERPTLGHRASTASSRSTILGGSKNSKTTLTREKTITEANKSSTRAPQGLLKLAEKPTRLTTPKAISAMAVGSKITKRVPSAILAPAGSRVSNMTRYFDRMTTEAERERQRQIMIMRGRRARPIMVPRASANVFISSKDALKEDSDDEGSSSQADDELEADEEEDKAEGTARPVKGEKAAISSAGKPPVAAMQQASPPDISGGGALSASSTLSNISLQSSESSTDARPGTSTDSAASVPASPLIGADAGTISRMSTLSESEMSTTGTETRSLMKTISSFLTYRGAEWPQLEYSLLVTEHLIEGSNYVVREDEPSSLIAYFLSSKVYKDMMKESQLNIVAAGSETFMPDQPVGHIGRMASNWDVLEFQTDAGTDVEDTTKKPVDRHLRLNLDHSVLHCSMRVYFADQFEALRRNCGCDELFLESLARCVKWDALGGKSGSAFLKTKDDRFIVKEVSQPEMRALMEFAPRYFEHMSRALINGYPTVLAKIFGFFRISFNNTSSGKRRRMDVMVMENIYHNKTVTRQFDLKGSTRNRHVEVTQGKNQVLLDENLVEMAYDTPLYVREHTKKRLMEALHNDSLFLEKNNVMDYSLIVGIDQTSLELVVGIVDFLRPYTWDKRLETWVKETAYIGGGKREPTVLNPRIYKTRFREAMSRYFLLVPDRWTTMDAVNSSQVQPSTLPPAGTVKSKGQALNANEEVEQYIAGSTQPRPPGGLKAFLPMTTASA